MVALQLLDSNDLSTHKWSRYKQSCRTTYDATYDNIIIWSGQTIYDNINGPGGQFMHVHNWSGYNINGPPQVLHGLGFLWDLPLLQRVIKPLKGSSTYQVSKSHYFTLGFQILHPSMKKIDFESRRTGVPDLRSDDKCWITCMHFASYEVPARLRYDSYNYTHT